MLTTLGRGRSALAILLLLSACRSGGPALPRYSPSLARADEIRKLTGLSPFGAAFLAMTAFEVVSQTESEVRLKATFPNAATADYTVTVTPGQRYTATADELAAGGGPRALDVHFSHEETGDKSRYRLEYFVPNGAVRSSLGAPSVPRRLRDRIPGGIHFELASARTSAVRTLALAAQQDPLDPTTQAGSRVVVETMVIEGGKEGAEALEGMIEKGMLGEAEGSLTKGAGALKDIVEAAEAGNEVDEMVKELNEAEEQIREPSNDLTEKAYEDDPGLQQQLLDEVTEIRIEIEAAVAAQFLNREISVISALAESPALAIILAPVVDWNNRTLTDYLKGRIAAIKRQANTGTFKKPPEQPRRISPVPIIPPADSSGPPHLKPGEWLARYERNVDDPDGGLKTTDHGWVVFSVNAQGEVQGKGWGQYAVHMTMEGGHADGGTSYGFEVGGTVTPTIDIYGVNGTRPDGFDITLVYDNGNILKRPMPTLAPGLFPTKITLKDGAVATQRIEGGMKDYSTITFTNKYP